MAFFWQMDNFRYDPVWYGIIICNILKSICSTNQGMSYLVNTVLWKRSPVCVRISCCTWILEVRLKAQYRNFLMMTQCSMSLITHCAPIVNGKVNCMLTSTTNLLKEHIFLLWLTRVRRAYTASDEIWEVLFQTIGIQLRFKLGTSTWCASPF
jgi:hypothetical protein